ncbi:MAG: type II toxin-antitoxin system VapC family toxin [Gammaproteobacteria bacterium]|nr:type II toxin-antitoxin system VapC family toxin [Gammaproteobacteria bacterium]
MNALDTNVLVRFLVQDDGNQCARVNRLLHDAERDKKSLFVPLLVVLELIWVLQSVYEVERRELLEAIASLLQLPVLEFEKKTVIREFIRSANQSSSGLADLLIGESSKASGCEAVLTFDKDASKTPLFRAL